jgi:hypothetical protein
MQQDKKIRIQNTEAETNGLQIKYDEVINKAVMVVICLRNYESE